MGHRVKGSAVKDNPHAHARADVIFLIRAHTYMHTRYTFACTYVHIRTHTYAHKCAHAPA